ncbi:MAG: DUF4097 family beta strand repeat-containing protein [Bacteroidota bacterium]
MRKLIFIIVSFCLAFSVAIAQGKKETKTFSGITDVRLTTSSGNGTIKKGSGKTVKVTVSHTYKKGYNPIFEKSGSRLTLKEDFGSGSHSGTSNWTLEVPDGINLKFKTGSGDLSIEGLDIEVNAYLGSGDILLRDLQGDVKARTGSGDIEGYDLEAEIDFDSGSGDVEIENSAGLFKVNVGSGDLDINDVNITESSSFISGSGDIKVKLSNELNQSISVNSGSGNVTLDFNGTPISGYITMQVRERNGRIEAPFSFEKENVESNTVTKRTKIGDKEINITLTTGSGVASIKK